ncbi:MAG: hypothetical protein LBQ24_05095 [Candidatus Peribacteria bacterium]|jgi:hypothetical protein|nr:hypothetical protein [Candidatus Peribacteria bacterium]
MIKNEINTKIIVAPLLVHKKYDENNQIKTDKTDKIIEIMNTLFMFFDNTFAVFAEITKNALISIIQKIFILIHIKIESKSKNPKLYKFVFIHLDLAISSFIITLINFLLNIKNNV